MRKGKPGISCSIKIPMSQNASKTVINKWMAVFNFNHLSFLNLLKTKIDREVSMNNLDSNNRASIISPFIKS